MEGLGLAANVAAVIELSANIASLCFQYLTAVKDAKKDIERLRAEVNQVGDILREIQRLLHGPDGARLSASQKLCNSLKDCFLQLKELETRLTPRTASKAMSRLGVRALSWPFKANNIEKIVTSLERCKQTFVVALEVDQTWVPNLE
jgi:hypothetical protein